MDEYEKLEEELQGLYEVRGIPNLNLLRAFFCKKCFGGALKIFLAFFTISGSTFAKII